MPNGAQIHLMVNHLPIVGSLIGLLVLLAGFVLKNQSVRRTGVALLAFAALTTLPAYFSGEEAEEVIEHLPGISEALIHDHEEAAELALALLAGAGLLAAATIGSVILKKEKWESKLQVLCLLVAVISFGVLANAGHLGGLIRHPEIRADFSQTAPMIEPSQSESEEHD
jgi:uncharacterized membrane protein